MSIQIINPYSIRLGVVGGGTMGSGIALAGLLANMAVTLYDVSPEVLDRAREYTSQHLQRKGREISLGSLILTTDLEAMRGAGVVVEAIPEDLALKIGLFSRLDAICPPPAILATNTSTLPVTAIAAAVANPQRVAGMHFFNPAAVMPLVEIVRGAQTNPDTIESLLRLAQLIGKTPVVAKDTPGFIVNRVARPFYGEALRLLGESIATHEEIDRLLRLSGGFRMGPFELMDLIGLDVNLTATQSIFEQTFFEPRYRPHRIQAQMVNSRNLGRKTGRGFYEYSDNKKIAEPALPSRVSKQNGQILITAGTWAPGLGALCRTSGYEIHELPSRMEAFLPQLQSRRQDPPGICLVVAGKDEGLRGLVTLADQELPPDTLIISQCADVTLTEIASWIGYPRRLAGIDGLFAGSGKAVTLVASPTLTPQAHSAAESFFRSLGRLPIWVQDSPGLVVPRVVTTLMNEAAFALEEGVADLQTIDKAMQLGVNYPHGPLAWAKEVGYARVLSILDHLHAEYNEDRYRAAPILRRWVRLEQIIA